MKIVMGMRGDDDGIDECGRILGREGVAGEEVAGFRNSLGRRPLGDRVPWPWGREGRRPPPRWIVVQDSNLCFHCRRCPMRSYGRKSVAGSMPMARNRASKFESTMYVNVRCLGMHEWAGLKRGRLHACGAKQGQ